MKWRLAGLALLAIMTVGSAGASLPMLPVQTFRMFFSKDDASKLPAEMLERLIKWHGAHGPCGMAGPLSISGHTSLDELDSLAVARLERVKQALIRGGVNPVDIDSAIAEGHSRLLNPDPGHEAENRRVEIVLRMAPENRSGCWVFGDS